MKNKDLLVGFIGQGWIGKNYANDFEKRGFKTVRYSLEKEYISNKGKIKDCDVVFIAVPTPTTPKGFDGSLVESAISLVGKGKIAVIKSTILPGTTARLQEIYSDRIVLYSPEFLSESTAAYDAANPFSNIIGLSKESKKHRDAAAQLLKILPKSKFSLVCTSTEAEIVKYTHNASGYFQIILFNIMYDLAIKLGSDWQKIQKAISADPLVCNRYSQPVHKSGRGAGGGCFIKDVAALREFYQKSISEDVIGLELLQTLEKKNIQLLSDSGKDLALLAGVYGGKIVKK